MKIILASSSPRRKELLESAGVYCEIRIPNTDESYREGESATEHAQRNAREKARVIYAELNSSEACVVIAADTIVVLDGAILGKPESEDEARMMLKRLKGRTHDVCTGVALFGKTDEGETREVDLLSRTAVTFREFSDVEIDAYIRTGDPMDKAGAYGIQSKAAHFVQRVEGSYTNVVGLPLAEVMDVLRKEFGGHSP